MSIGFIDVDFFEIWHGFCEFESLRSESLHDGSLASRGGWDPHSDKHSRDGHCQQTTID